MLRHLTVRPDGTDRNSTVLMPPLRFLETLRDMATTKGKHDFLGQPPSHIHSINASTERKILANKIAAASQFRPLYANTRTA